LTKQQIARAVYSKCPGLSRLDARRLVDAVLEEIISALAHEGKVALRDFGAFCVLHKRERIGRNPKTGVVAPITARRVVVFRASDNMKSKVAPGGR
jgi:integration host factor subunit alpha